MKGKVPVFIVAGLLLLELVIYLAAASQSGTEYYVIIEDSNGKILYKTRGKALTRYEEISFRSTFGPVEKYKVRVVSSKKPFPFRGWLASAIGVPIGLVLLIAFAVKSYQAMFEYKTTQSSAKVELSQLKGWRYLIHLLGSLSVFQLGFMVAVLAVIIWVVPNVTESLFKATVTFVERHAIFVTGVLIFLGGLVVWIIYLRYKLSKEIVKYQFELSKIKLERARELGSMEDVPLLEGQSFNVRENNSTREEK